MGRLQSNHGREANLPPLKFEGWSFEDSSKVLHDASRAALAEASVTEEEVGLAQDARIAECAFLALALPGSLEKLRRELVARYCTDRLDLIRRKYPAERVVRRALKAAYNVRSVSAESIKAHEKIIAAEERVGRARTGVLAAHGDRLKECFGTRDLWQAMEAERANWHIWSH